jgi:hypothetical protein
VSFKRHRSFLQTGSDEGSFILPTHKDVQVMFDFQTTGSPMTATSRADASSAPRCCRGRRSCSPGTPGFYFSNILQVGIKAEKGLSHWFSRKTPCLSPKIGETWLKMVMFTLTPGSYLQPSP